MIHFRRLRHIDEFHFAFLRYYFHMIRRQPLSAIVFTLLLISPVISDAFRQVIAGQPAESLPMPPRLIAVAGRHYDITLAFQPVSIDAARLSKAEERHLAISQLLIFS